MKTPSPFDQELGKALCDRLGLERNSTLQEYSAENSGKHVWLTMTTMKSIPLDDFNELRIVAAGRANESAG